MTQLYFCKSWFAAKGRPTELWTGTQANKAHNAKSNYTVLVGSVERPTHIIVVTRAAVFVDFLDDNLREALSYQFQEASPGLMFLTMAVHRQYVNDSDKVSGGTTYTFTQDGEIRICREAFVPEQLREVASSRAEVLANFEATPKFGAYAGFLRAEREV